jgi:hypothetical protein
VENYFTLIFFILGSIFGAFFIGFGLTLFLDEVLTGDF